MYGLDSISFVTVVVSIIFVVLATLAVIARLFTRKVLKVGLGADDWLSILALAAYFLYTANELFSIKKFILDTIRLLTSTTAVFIGGGDQQYEDPSVAAANLAKYLEVGYNGWSLLGSSNVLILIIGRILHWSCIRYRDITREVFRHLPVSPHICCTPLSTSVVVCRHCLLSLDGGGAYRRLPVLHTYAKLLGSTGRRSLL